MATGLNVGGAERVVLDLARAFADAGHPVSIVALANDRELLSQVDTQRIEIHFLAMNKSPGGFLDGARRLAAIIRRLQVDVIHAHMPHAVFVASAARLLAGTRVPLVHTSHNFSFSPTLGLALRATRRLRSVDVLLAPGQHAGINARRTVTIPNGIQLDTDAAPAVRGNRSRPVILSVARLTEQKNPAALVDAFATLRQRGEDRNAVLQLAGDGPLRAGVQAQITRLGLDDSVTLLGTRSDVRALLASADVFVLSSRWEGLPLAVLEAGAAGLPVVAPPTGGLPWLLDDNCGYLSEPERLAETLATVLADPDEARRRAARFRAKVIERFSVERAMADHLKLYQELIAIR